MADFRPIVRPVSVAAGSQTQTSGTLSFSNANGVTFGMSNSSVITASVAAAAGNTGFVSAGAATASLGTVVFSNSNGMSFGVNGQTVTGSYTVPSVTHSSWTVSDAATSATVGRLAFTNSNGLTLSLSTSNNGNHTVIGSYTVPTVTSWTVSDNATSATVGRLAFTQSNGLTLSLSTSNNGNHTVIGSYTVPSVTNSSWTVSDSVTSATVGRLAFTASNGLTLTLSTSNNGNHTVIGSYSQSGQAFSAGGGSSTFSTLSFSNANGISFTNTNGQVGASYTVPTVTNSSWTVSDAATSATVGRLAFTQSNGLTLSLSTSNNGNHTVIGSYTVPSVTNSSWTVSDNATSLTISRLAFTQSNGLTLSLSTGAGAATVIGSYTVPTQSNQTEGLYVVGNTTANSSSRTYDARTLSLSAAGNLSIGWDTAASQLVFSGATAAAGTVSGYGVGNTSGTSSGTYANVLSISAGGALTVAASNSGFNLSVPATSSLSATGIVSISTNGSTISIGAATFNAYALNSTTQNSSSNLDLRSVSFNATGYGLSVGYSNGSIVLSSPPHVSYLNLCPHYGATATSSFGQSTSHVIPFQVPEAISIGSVRLYDVGTVAASSTQGLVNGSTLSMTGATSHNFVFYTRGTGANSMSLQYATSTQVVDVVSLNVQNAAGANSSQLSYTYRFSLGNTSFTKDYSSTAQSYNFHTSGVTDLTGTKMVDYPCGLSLSPGQWFLAYGRSTTFATQNAVLSVATRLNISYDSQFVVSQNTIVAGTLGGATNSSVVVGQVGLGSFTTGGAAGTTNSLNMSVISSGSSNQIPMFQLLRIA